MGNSTCSQKPVSGTALHIYAYCDMMPESRMCAVREAQQRQRLGKHLFPQQQIDIRFYGGGFLETNSVQNTFLRQQTITEDNELSHWMFYIRSARS
jgi:hypothetical protein